MLEVITKEMAMTTKKVVIIDDKNDIIQFDLHKYAKSFKCAIDDDEFFLESGQPIKCINTLRHELIHIPLFELGKSYFTVGFNVFEYNTLLLNTILMETQSFWPICLNINLIKEHFDLSPFKTNNSQDRFLNLII